MANFLKFRNETNRFATFPSALAYNVGTGAYQFEFKIRLFSLPASGIVGFFGTNSATTAAGIAFTSAGALRVYSSGATRYNSADGFVLADSNWHTYRVEHDAGGAWRMYRDGVQISSGTYSSSQSVNNVNCFGRASTASAAILDADVEYATASGVTNGDTWDANISNLSSSTWATTSGSNNATLQAGFPADGSQWGTESADVSASISISFPIPVVAISATTDSAPISASISINFPIFSVSLTAELTGGAQPISLDTVSDLVNASAVNSTVTDATSSTPIVHLRARAATMQYSPNGQWRQLVGKLTGCAGKQPVIRFDRATQESNTSARDANWRCYWTTDFVTFTAFPAADTSSGSSGYYQVQHTSAFTDDVVYVMTNPMKPVAVKQAYIADLISAHPGIVGPTDSATAYKLANPSAPDNACYVQPSILYPTEAGEPMSGVQIGQDPVIAFEIDFGGPTTDGGPKRKVIIGQGQHAQGEEQSFMSMMGFIDCLLNDPAAAARRANFIYRFYVNINGSGIKGGHKRLGFESTNDYNREWLKGSPLATVAAVRAAMLSDCGGSADLLLDFHGQTAARGDYNNIHSSVYEPENNALWNTLAPSYFNMTNADIGTVDASQGYIINWAYTVLGTKYATHAEHANRGNNSPENFAAIGAAWAKTMLAADEAGMFYTPPSGSAVISFTMPQMSVAAEASQTVPAVDAAVNITMPQMQVSAVASALSNDREASISLTMPQMVVAVSANSESNDVSATIAFTMPQMAVSAVAESSSPTVSASVAFTMPQMVVSVLSGDFEYFSSTGTNIETVALSTHIEYTL